MPSANTTHRPQALEQNKLMTFLTVRPNEVFARGRMPSPLHARAKDIYGKPPVKPKQSY
jgi:hypothetical protein